MRNIWISAFIVILALQIICFIAGGFMVYYGYVEFGLLNMIVNFVFGVINVSRIIEMYNNER